MGGKILSNDPCYKEGMLIFQSLPNTSQLVMVIQDATDSPITHVGILHKNDDGDWVVIESIGNRGRETPIDEFLSRSNNVAWLKMIEGVDAKRFVTEASRLTKTYPEYDPNFKYDNGKLYCSEMIALAAKAIGIDLFDVDVRASWLDIRDVSVAQYLQSRHISMPDMDKWRILPPNTLFFSNKLVNPQCAANAGNTPMANIPNHALYDNLPGKTTSEKMDYLKKMWGNFSNQVTVKKETINGYTHYFFKLKVNGIEYGLTIFGQFPEEEKLAQEILKQLKVN